MEADDPAPLITYESVPESTEINTNLLLPNTHYVLIDGVTGEPIGVYSSYNTLIRAITHSDTPTQFYIGYHIRIDTTPLSPEGCIRFDPEEENEYRASLVIGVADESLCPDTERD